MQNIPDSLRGFQPDMDPNLREVLEALEDDLPKGQIDNESDEKEPEDMFSELIGGGLADENAEDDDDVGYETDDTVKGVGYDITGSEYLTEMAKYKTTVKTDEETDSLSGDFETESNFSKSSAAANSHRTSKQRRKRRQKLGGAYSEAGTDFSMTSSSNFRNEGLTTLDDRFEKVLFFLSLLTLLDSRGV
jgi:protein LTV1